MTNEERKELAAIEAAKYTSSVNDKVIVVMPFQAAWLDPSDEAMDAIRDFAADRNGSVHEFPSTKVKELANKKNN